MASITRLGDFQYQAIIRRKGYPSQTKTFETRKDADKWACEVESKMDKGRFRDQREIEATSFLVEVCCLYFSTNCGFLLKNRQKFFAY